MRVEMAYVYDGVGELVKTIMTSTQADGSIHSQTTAYVGEFYEWSLVDEEVTERVTYGGVALRERSAAGDELFFFQKDHLGSTVLTVDTAGTPLAELRYSPFGEARYLRRARPRPNSALPGSASSL